MPFPEHVSGQQCQQSAQGHLLWNIIFRWMSLEWLEDVCGHAENFPSRLWKGYRPDSSGLFFSAKETNKQHSDVISRVLNTDMKRCQQVPYQTLLCLFPGCKRIFKSGLMFSKDSEIYSE
jgi:hypothetical protein